MIENIPAELRALPQWVVAGSDKIPINPTTGQRADPANPASGASFAEAVGAGMRHIGFILGKDDPFCVIDLDDPWQRKDKSAIQSGDPDFAEAQQRAERHSKIYNSFETYAELSQSGTGVHLVMRGQIPCGVRRDKVEIYSDQRYIIFTGNVLKSLPVADCQPLLDGIFLEMGKMMDESGDLIEEDPILEDSEVWDMATRASNAEKFLALCKGEWQQFACYPSQSEADYALISMLAFYTRSNEQVRRMFRATELAKRPKAQRNDSYINRSLRRIRAKEAPLVDISKILDRNTVQTEFPMEIETPTPHGGAERDIQPYSFPPGLVGDVARYVLSSAIRPVPEVALAAAIALCAGVCGRSYNISGTGLNQYVILLAKTGRGKEGAASGIDNLMASVRQTIPMADKFIGPAAFASGQALIKTLNREPCFVSVLGEFGLMLQQICDPQANAALVMLRRVLLDIYTKSGHTKVLRPSVYSDSEKNTQMIQAPNVTLLGESTPDTFFKGLNESHIAEGLIPRFTIIEYDGPRPPMNPHAFHRPTEDLVKAFGDLVTVAVNTAQNHTCAPVTCSPEAQAVFETLNKEADERINHAHLDTEAELWNRAHLKALKLGALVAVGLNPHAPNITHRVAEWAVNLTRAEINGIAERFKAGELGLGEAKQESEVKRLFNHFQTLDVKQRTYHRCPKELMESAVCPVGYLTLYTRRNAAFHKDRRGASRALADTLADMVKREILEMIPLDQLRGYGMKSPIYYPGPGWR